MGGTPDLTDVAPVRRMAVARGTLKCSVSPDEATRTMAESAGLLCVKRAGELLPHALPGQVTHVDFIWQEADGGLACTCTVQAYARAPIGNAARLGVCASLVAAAGKDDRITDVHVVQEVE